VLEHKSGISETRKDGGKVTMEGVTGRAPSPTSKTLPHHTDYLTLYLSVVNSLSTLFDSVLLLLNTDARMQLYNVNEIFSIV